MASPTVSISPSSTSAAASATCTTAVPGKYGYVPPDACNSNYNYDPQFAPAVAVAVIFGIFTLVHLVLAIVFRKVRRHHRARASRGC
jgi:cbb3-type cytochrome oxidase subunit 3